MPITIEPRPNYQGPLIKVPTGKPGQFIRMTEEEARRRGYLPAGPEQAPVAHKKRTPRR